MHPIRWIAIGNLLCGAGVSNILIANGWSNASVPVGVALIIIGLAIEYGRGKRAKYSKLIVH